MPLNSTGIVFVVVICSAVGISLARQTESASQARPSVGVFPGLPSPIARNGNVSDFAVWLALSEAQTTAVSEAFEQYWSQWRAIQETEFATFAPRQTEIARIPWRRPQPQTLNAFNEQRQRIERGLRMLDESLFASIVEVLAVEQLPLLDHFRTRREIEFFVADPIATAWFKGRLPLDLRELLARSVPEFSEVVEGAVLVSDIRLRDVLSKLQPAIDDARACWITRTEKMSFGDKFGPDSQMETRVEHRDIIHAWAECLKPVSHIVAESYRSSNDAVNKIAITLPPESARLLEASHYVVEFHQREIFYQHLGLELALRDASRSPDLDETTREKLGHIYERWLRESRPLDRAIADGATAIRVRLPADLSVGMGPPSEAEAMRNTSIPLVEQLYRETQQQFAQAVPKDIRREFVTQANAFVNTLMPDKNEPRARPLIAVRANAACPGPLTASEIDGLCDLAGDDSNRAQLGTALETYTREYAANALQPRFTMVAPAQVSRESLDATRRRLSEGLAVEQRLRELDNALLSSIEGAGLSPAVAPLTRLHRLGQWAVFMQRAHAGDLLGAPVDLPNALMQDAIGADERSQALGAMLNRMPELIAALNDYCTTLPDLHDKRELASASRWLRPTAEERPNPEAWESLQQLRTTCEADLQVALGRVAASHSNLLRLKREVLDDMCASLPQNAADALNREFIVQAFPNVLADIATAAARLKRSIALPSITQEQRDALAAWAIEFNSQCDQRLPQAHALLWSLAIAEKQDEVAGSISALKVEQMRIDQQQLANQSDATLRRILNAEQLTAVGLPQPAP